MWFFKFLKRPSARLVTYGLSPVKLKKGELYHVQGRLKGSVYAYDLICSIRTSNDALLEPVEINRAVVDLILRSERREAKRGAATILFGEASNFTIRFTGKHPKMGTIELISRGLVIRAAYIHAPSVAVEICKFIQWQAEHLEHGQEGFLVYDNQKTVLFWHAVMLSTYFRVLWGDRP